MFEWEEGTFLGLKALYQRIVVRPQKRRELAVKADLKDQRQYLFVLSQLIAERPVLLFETDEHVLCDGNRIFLPPSMALGSSSEINRRFYETKVLLGAMAIYRRWAPGAFPANWKQAEPNIARRFDDLQKEFSDHDLEMLFGPVMIDRALESDRSAESIEKDQESSKSDDDSEMTEIQGQGQLELEVEIDGGDDGPGADMPIHTFEKTETLEEHTGLSRKTDDEDELEDHEEALRDVKMNRVLRSRERPRSIYRADALFEAMFFETKDSGLQGIPYPEWNYKQRKLQKDWCRVLEGKESKADGIWYADTQRKHRSLILDLRKKVAHLANVSLRVKRQPTGNEFDIDALVAREVDLRSGRTPDENLFVDRRKELHDVAALMVLDRSFSTDGYLGGQRVLDIIRETMLCLGEVMDAFIESFGVATFSSNTRQQCYFNWVKSFDDSWHDARYRLGSIRANGYTRIGPALRHAHECLMKRQAERRVVVLLTDGRPSDYDRYEGPYGIHDVKHAIETGRKNGISTYAFAVEERARENFPAMFSPDHFSVVPKPRALTGCLCDLFLRLRTTS